MILAIVGRVGLGLLLALVLSFVGVWVAWGLYYFFTDTSSKTLRDVMLSLIHISEPTRPY